jgi:hypothetical protein
VETITQGDLDEWYRTFDLSALAPRIRAGATGMAKIPSGVSHYVLSMFKREIYGYHKHNAMPDPLFSMERLNGNVALVEQHLFLPGPFRVFIEHPKKHGRNKLPIQYGYWSDEARASKAKRDGRKLALENRGQQFNARANVASDDGPMLSGERIAAGRARLRTIDPVVITDVDYKVPIKPMPLHVGATFRVPKRAIGVRRTPVHPPADTEVAKPGARPLPKREARIMRISFAAGHPEVEARNKEILAKTPAIDPCFGHVCTWHCSMTTTCPVYTQWAEAEHALFSTEDIAVEMPQSVASQNAVAGPSSFEGSFPLDQVNDDLLEWAPLL